MNIEVRIDDLSSAGIQALIAGHLEAMRGHSPPGHAHALALDGLRQPGMTVWSAWWRDRLCGCGALRALAAHTGEIKSMRTAEGFLRRGVAQAVLDAIVLEARARGYRRLVLETGTGDAFAAAHRLYLRNGFDWCGAFAPYTATGFNVFMTRALAQDSPAEG